MYSKENTNEKDKKALLIESKDDCFQLVFWGYAGCSFIWVPALLNCIKIAIKVNFSLFPSNLLKQLLP
jgi:hypothetical protein